MDPLTACHDELIAEAHEELGKSEIAAGNVNEALKHLSKSLVILEKIVDPPGICKAHLELVAVYEVLGIFNSTKRISKYQITIKLF